MMNKRQAKKRAKQRAERSRAYASDIYSTGAEVQSAVNRINNRIRTAVEHFGQASDIVQKMFSKLDSMIPLSNIRYNKDGIMQISSPYQLFKDRDLHNVVNQLDTKDIETYGDIKARYERSFENFQTEANFIGDADSVGISIDNFISTITKLDTAKEWAYAHENTAPGGRILEIMRAKGGHTYDDLLTAINTYERATT